MPPGEPGLGSNADLRAEVRRLQEELAATRAANAALAAAAGEDGGIPPQFALALESPQQTRHQAVMLGDGCVAVLAQSRAGMGTGHVWRMTEAVLATAVPRSAREIRHTDQLPPGVEAVARREGGKLSVAVSEVGVADRAGAVRCAVKALGSRPWLAVLAAGAVAGGAAARALRSHAAAASAGAVALTGTVAAVAVLGAPLPPVPHSGARPAVIAPAHVTRPAQAQQQRDGGRIGTGVPGAGSAPPRRGDPGTAPSPGSPPAPPSSPQPSGSVPPTARQPVPLPTPPPVVKKVTHLVCHLDLLGIRICVKV